MRRALGLAVMGVFAIGAACASKPPPTPPGVDASVAPMPGPRPADSTAMATPDDAAAPIVDAGTTAIAVTIPDAGDPGALPQTHDKPAPSSPALDARAATLWDAIVHDDPDRATPFFFPVGAYEQVKAISFPASDWRRRLLSAYKRDIHGLAKRLGSSAESAKFVRLDIPDDRAKWVDVNEESNKLGYYRVYGTRIVYEIDGKERSMEVSSLISWRGEWYVVHLTGFK